MHNTKLNLYKKIGWKSNYTPKATTHTNHNKHTRRQNRTNTRTDGGGGINATKRKNQFIYKKKSCILIVKCIKKKLIGLNKNILNKSKIGFKKKGTN